MKGQWFAISAIFIAFSVFAVSSNLRSFNAIDTAGTSTYNEDYHFANLKQGLQRTIQLSGNTCEELSKNLNDYIYFFQLSKGRIGYVVDVFYTIQDCASKTVTFDLILLQSEKYQVWEGIRPSIEGT